MYGSVWLQLVDDAGNYSDPVEFGNDIIAPNAPTINRAVSTCKTQSCRITLSWIDNGPDTDYYQVTYATGFNIKKSLPVNGTTLILDIPSDGSIKKFSVQAFDRYGNPSLASNNFLASMVPGVITTARLVGGQLVVTTLAVPGSKETIKTVVNTPPAKLVPAAQAAEDPEDSEDVQVAGSQDWIRIVMVVILLLAIAGGFYSLSKNLQRSELDIPDKSKKETKPGKSGGKKNTRKKKRRNQP